MLKQVIIAATTMATLSACGGPTPGADVVLSYSEADQVDALLKCQNDQGITAQLSYDVLQLSDGRVSVFAVNTGDISLAQARSLNQCMQTTLVAQGGATTPHQPATAPRDPAGRLTPPSCPPEFTGMYRGTQYCENGEISG